MVIVNVNVLVPVTKNILLSLKAVKLLNDAAVDGVVEIVLPFNIIVAWLSVAH